MKLSRPENSGRLILIPAIICAIAAATIVGPWVSYQWQQLSSTRPSVGSDYRGPLTFTPRLTVWWDFPDHLARQAEATNESSSNVAPSDYAGAESCKACHAQNYAKLSDHPHRRMNAPATSESVLGDFSASASIDYRGGQASFDVQDGVYTMSLVGGETRRVYQVTQTIGSRFFQYYVGRQTAGPEPPEHKFYHQEHVLPFGYWLAEKQWVPVVHIGPEVADEMRADPYEPPDEGSYYAEYATSCNYCHDTFALGDLFGRRPHQMGEHAPTRLHWSVHRYLSENRPQELREIEQLRASGNTNNPMTGWDAQHYAVNYGISCEACHLGSREHVQSAGKILPRFFPASDSLVTEGETTAAGRTAENVNWACARCHTGTRPTFAAGMSTWNSVEYADAAKGSCYSELRCIECHNPHEKTGQQWQRSADHDDAVCLKCHGDLKAAESRAAHTHHVAGSEGDRCLNCHMPRINEGLQDVVRTHTIFSPTQPQMIEANQPNACNLCHVDEPIDWTLKHLKDWYGRSYDEQKLAQNYPDRAAPVAQGWLKSPRESVRLVGADALARSGQTSAVPHLLQALDDPLMVNRQFAARSLERFVGTQVKESGYHFYQTRQERRRPLKLLQEALKLAPEQPLRAGTD
jgi:hypothetical protein